MMQSRCTEYLEEGQPPPKKICTQENELIKRLSEKQLSTSTSLQKELNYSKEFERSNELPLIPKLHSKIYTLNEFENELNDMNCLNTLKSKGLSQDDIEFLRAYKAGETELKNKFKNTNSDILNTKLKNILDLLNSNQNCDNNETYENKLVSPMDELPDLEKQFMENNDYYTSDFTVAKIRKKARNLGNKIETLVKEKYKLEEPKNNLKCGEFVRHSLWDCKETIEHNIKNDKTINKNVYTCKKQNYYTIRNGEIVKLENTKNNSENSFSNAQKKLSIEEIRALPKFKNYETGTKCSKLFLKNLSQNVTEDNLRSLLNEKSISNIKIMTGKMKGQAFIDFKCEDSAENSLHILNGLIFDNKPIIVQYGKIKDKT